MSKAKEYKIKVKVQKPKKSKSHWYTRLFVKPSILTFVYIAEFDEYKINIGRHHFYQDELEALLSKIKELNR